MNARHLQVIAMGVAVLLLLWGGSELWSRRADTAPPRLHLPALAERDVDTVAITHGADTVLLAKQAAGVWTVNRHPASQSGVNDLFHALRDSVRAELAAERPSSFARMGVESTGARQVRLVGGGKTLAQLLVGGHGAGDDASYVRLVGDARTYLLPGRLPALVGRPADDWRDRQIGAVAPESIAVVEIQRGAKRTTLRKQGTKWMLSSGAPADSAAVARLLQSFRTVNASGFATERQSDSLTFARPERRVTVRGAGAGGGTLLALTFDSTAGGFWVHTAAGGTVYRLDFWLVDQLTPAEDALKPHS